MFLILIIFCICALIVVLQLRRKKEKEMIAQLKDVTVIKKQIVNNSGKPQLIPNTTGEGLSDAGTKVSDSFFVANDSNDKKNITYQVTIKAILQNNRVIEENVIVSKKVYNQVNIDSTYPLNLFK